MYKVNKETHTRKYLKKEINMYKKKNHLTCTTQPQKLCLSWERKIVDHADWFSPSEHMMFISFSLKRTTVIVNLGDRWLKFCFEVNYEVWKGGETVLRCWVCEFMLFQTARPWSPPLDLLLCPASEACAEERRPSDFPSRLLTSPRITKTTTSFWDHHDWSGTYCSKRKGVCFD